MRLIEITGKALSGEWGIDDIAGKGIPVLRTTNLTNEGIINYENVVTRTVIKKNIEEKYLKYGDIIIEKSGGSDKQPVGRVAFFDGSEKTYLFNNFTGVLRIRDKEKWESKYVFYSLFANYRNGGTKAFENRTTGIHNLKIDDYISKCEVKAVDIKEQKYICKTLDMICELIKLQKQQLVELDTLIKSRFVEMFGDVQHEEKYLGIPLKELCNTISGGTPSTKVPEYYQGDIPWISTVSLGANYIDGTNAKGYITENAIANSATHLIPAGNILFGTRVGVGKSSLNDVDICINQDIVAIVDIDKSRYSHIFIKYVLDAYQPHFDTIKKGATILGITIEDLKESLIPQVSLELQRQFESFVTQVDKLKVS